MARRSTRDDPEVIRSKLVHLLTEFESVLRTGDLRSQVRELVPANHLIRDLGSSLIAADFADSAIDRILTYLRTYTGQVIHGDELMVVAGISEYARRVRELRVELGWPIMSGVTFAQLRKSAEEENSAESNEIPVMRSDEYLLLEDRQDREAAFRWKLANKIRKKDRLSVRSKLLEFFRENVGVPVSGEELRYIAKGRTEWARRARELRTEFGWPISTKSNGRPELSVGVYILEEDRQSPPHDRKIKDAVRRSVMMRDDHTCQRSGCGWNFDKWNPSDPRHLEVHHIQHHVKGGSNLAENLITYCNICHDIVHSEERSQDQ